jgi:uncharacterized protein YbjT (DUF2867 family)
MSSELVTVFGGSGFIGRTLVQHLAKAGYRVRVAVRRPNNALFVKPLGELGQVQLAQANVRNQPSVEAAVKDADYVVNLVSVLHESGNQTFENLHVKGSGIIAAACSRAGVKKLIQISSIGADEESGSKYARTKARGEKAVRENFPAATIIRPSVVFGPDDKFFNKFAGIAKIFRMLPVICGKTKMQPVYVGDVADAIASAIENDDAAGKIYEIGGPKIYEFRELLKMVNKYTEQNVPLIPIPKQLAYLKAFFLGMLPNPLITIDQVRLLEKDNVAGEGMPGLAELGVNAKPAEAIIPNYLVQHRPTGQFRSAS